MIIQIAKKSIDQEAEKFEEALVAVMAQRTKEYIKVKIGRDDDSKVNKIVQMTEFQMIVKENLQEFKTWYTKQMDKRVYAFADEALKDYYDNVLNGPSNYNGGVTDEYSFDNGLFDYGSNPGNS